MTEQPTIPDLRPVLLRAADQTGRLIEGTSPDDAGRATPCADWDVSALIEHLQGVALRIVTVLEGGPADSVPLRVASPTWAESRSEIDRVLADDELIERMVVVPWGTVPARAAVAMWAGELATHAWDLAVSTGRTDQLDEQLAEAVLPAAQNGIPAEGREHVPFGEVVEVGPDASAYERLVAWEGRDPAWPA